jgi:murein L,D-transpeptidase YcbB/YkuD
MIAPGFQASIRAITRGLVLGAALIACSPIISPWAAASPTVDAATSGIVMIELSSARPLIAAGKTLDREKLRAFYAGRDYRLAWDNAAPGLGRKAAVVYNVLASADAEGLDPADYHTREIARFADASTQKARIVRDFLITDGVLRYAADVSTGKLAPGQTDERTAPAQGMDWSLYLAAATLLPAETLADMLAALPPTTQEYRALTQRLADLRQMRDSGVTWAALPDGPTVHPGVHDPAVPALRDRLVAEGRIASPPHAAKLMTGDLYDAGLSAAVALFQGQHGIKPDGVIGKDTRAALDVPLDARIQQVIANMERERWIDIPTTGRMVEVNLAAYALKVYQDGDQILTMPVVVGTPENQTPIISSRITTVVLNPNWTLPPNVIKEMLPRIHTDETYLAGKGIGRFETDGHVRLVQPPGPSNPLGHYKFIMPNDQDIYLHDSPDAAKFHYTLRAYSHGCVRLGEPAQLAALLLDDRVASLPASLAELTATWETRHIALSKPVPVSLVYRTAWLDKNGQLVLGNDDYGRDPKLFKAMTKPRSGQPSRRVAVKISPASVL